MDHPLRHKLLIIFDFPMMQEYMELEEVSIIMELRLLSPYKIRCARMWSMESIMGVYNMFGFKHLTKLNISKNEAIALSDMENCLDFPVLRTMAIFNTCNCDLKFLGNIPSIINLHIADYAGKDLNMLKKLPKLRRLSLIDSPKIHLSTIGSIINLTYLYIDPFLSKHTLLSGPLTWLGQLINLDTLIMGSFIFHKLEWIPQISQLRHLCLFNGYGYFNEYLLHLSYLETLIISYLTLPDKEIMERCPLVKYLITSFTYDKHTKIENWIKKTQLRLMDG